MSFALWEKAYNHLISKGYEVYPPDTKKGLCQSDYLIFKLAESLQYGELSTVKQNYDVLCYSKSYTGVLKLADRVRVDMAELVPFLFPTGEEQAPFFDQNVEAFMSSIAYCGKRIDKNVKQASALKSYNYSYSS